MDNLIFEIIPLKSMERVLSKKVPHYEQQFEFTCGPASLMMIFKHFDNKFVINKENETDIWRESSLAPLPPTTRYGLSFAALKRGYQVEILSNLKGLEYFNKIPKRLTRGRRLDLSGELMGMMNVQFEERKARAFRLGLQERRVKSVSAESIADALNRNGLSIMLTSARFFEDEDWAHWVVVTGHHNSNFYVNDPASPSHKGRRLFPEKEFEKINGYHGDQVLISIFL